jgi:hypothetical protein
VIKIEGRTGFAITSREMVLLSRPAPTAPPRITLVFDSGTSAQRSAGVEAAWIDGLPVDLALLRFKVVGEPPMVIDLGGSVAHAETMVVHVFGFPFGKALSDRKKKDPEISVTRGSVSKLDNLGRESAERIQIDGILNPGHIGAPMVDSQGRLVGIALGSIHGSSIGCALPAGLLAKALRPRLGQALFKPIKVADRDVSFRLEVPLIDPMGQVRSVFLMILDSWDGTYFPAPGRDETFPPLEGSRRIEMKIEGDKAIGSLTIDKLKIQSQAIGMHQVCHVDGRGTVFNVPASFAMLSSFA